MFGRAVIPLVALCISCASTPTPAPAPAPASTPAPAPASTITTATTTTTATATEAVPSGPPPTGGSVMVGDINAPKSFDPKPVIVALKPKLLDCYNQARATKPSLHGKIT